MRIIPDDNFVLLFLCVYFFTNFFFEAITLGVFIVLLSLYYFHSFIKSAYLPGDIYSSLFFTKL